MSVEPVRRGRPLPPRPAETENAAGLSVEERLVRLEHAVAAVALRLTANYPFRADGPGVDAAREIVAEYEAVREQLAVAAERGELQARLAELGEAA